MTAMTLLPFILILVVIGAAIAERINVPYPLVLVTAGIAIGFMPGMPTWHLPTHFVLGFFLPPILFGAARLIAWEDIQDNSLEIFSLSFVLIVVKTTVVAIVLHKIIPHMPLSAALVLGAIVSPTDSIAATSVLNKMGTRRHIVRMLEIESLFNDAISIVLYKVAVLFVFVGAINLTTITYETILSGIGGVMVGVVLSYFVGFIIKEFLTNSENDLPIIMSIILAYIAYLFADRIGVSGVLAVVAAGLFHKKTERTIKARTRLSEKTVWDTYIFFLNGLIFIGIGLQFPMYIEKVSYLPTKQLILFSIAILTLLLLIRFIWVALTEYLATLWSRWQRRHHYRRIRIEFDWRDTIIASWSGMRGMVSLALAVALPTEIAQGVPFPNRDLIIFLTIIAILFTLIGQGLTLPWLVKLLHVEKKDEHSLKDAEKIHHELTEIAMAHIDQLASDNHVSTQAAKQLIMNYYTQRLLHFTLAGKIDHDVVTISQEGEKLLSKVLDYERALLHERLNRGELSEEVYARIIDKIDRDEVSFVLYK